MMVMEGRKCVRTQERSERNFPPPSPSKNIYKLPLQLQLILPIDSCTIVGVFSVLVSTQFNQKYPDILGFRHFIEYIEKYLRTILELQRCKDV